LLLIGPSAQPQADHRLRWAQWGCCRRNRQGSYRHRAYGTRYTYPMTLPTAAILISGLALAVSALTFWFSFIHKGRLRMTKPSTIFFGPDGRGSGEPKVYLRTLLYSTGKRGQLIENMFVRLRRGESGQTFNVWVCGEDRLARGSGLFVGVDGVTLNHHFLHPRDGTRFDFLPGTYTLEVFASLVGRSRPVPLGQTTLTLTPEQSEAIQSKKAGVFYDWGPDSGSYHAHIYDRPRIGKPGDPFVMLMEAMTAPSTTADGATPAPNSP